MNLTTARVAELVDAADSKSAVRKDVLVRFQSRARVFLNVIVIQYITMTFLFKGIVQGMF